MFVTVSVWVTLEQGLPQGYKGLIVISLLKIYNRPFSYSVKESQSNDVMMQFEEFSNVRNSDRISNATRSNLAYKMV